MLIALGLFIVTLVTCFLVAVPVLARLARQFQRTAAAVGTAAEILDGRFLPRAEAQLQQTHETILELESVAARFSEIREQGEGVLSPIGDIAVAVERAVAPIVRTAGEFRLDRVRALGLGLRVAWQGWRRLRRHR